MKITTMNIMVMMMLMVMVSLKVLSQVRILIFLSQVGILIVLSQVRIRVKPVIVTSPEEVATTFSIKL